VTTRIASQSKVVLWQRRSYDVLTSDVVASRNPGPQPPTEWAAALHQLTLLSRKPVPSPSWWTPKTAFFGSVETRTDPTSYHWDGMKRLARGDPPLFAFQLTLAGWGNFQLYGQPPLRVTPGKAFIALMPSRHRYYLPENSPGWTFAWISIYHPYLLARIAKQVAITGPLFEVAPDGPLAASTARLVRGAIKKDFRNRFEVELALFEFLLACEQSAEQARDSFRDTPDQGRQLLDAVRSHIVAGLPKALDVHALAAGHGMSRTHFSHLFRARTGLTPAHFATEVRIHEAARMLLETHAPLKQIAAACGFANPNHFCKVFRRIQHVSPKAYRRTVR
jgi:AraC-like DNA-binding protein